MRKLLPACIGLFFSLAACQTRENAATMQAINKALMESNEIITTNNKMVLEALEGRRRDMITAEKASLWSPPALKVRDLSTTLISYLDSLKQQVKSLKDDDMRGGQQLFQQEEAWLYSKLVKYVKDVVGVLDPSMVSDNPIVHVHFRKDMESFRKELADRFSIKADSVGESLNGLDAWCTKYSKPATPLLAIAILNKLQHDVLVSSYHMIQYCYDHTSALICGYTEFRAIATVNSSYVRSGQTIEVTAGVGEFSAAMKPSITINGAPAKIDVEGVAVYSFKATGKPGEHSIPVNFKYHKPDGSQESITKKIPYTIAE
jgi:hypothetical protein